MRKIAILTSSSGECADRLVSLFNDGDRFRVEVVVTDMEGSGIADHFVGKDVEVAFVPRARWEESPEEIESLLSEHDVELLALDGFTGQLPAEVAKGYEGRIVELSSAENAPREVAAAFGRIDSGQAEEVKYTAVPPAPKSVDEEWADALHLNYDASRLRTTPPPMPGRPSVSPGPQPTDAAQASGRIGNMHQAYTLQQPLRGSGNNAEPMPPNYIVWAIIMMIFCCTIPGIVAIVFSSQVATRYAMGDIEGARRASDKAQIWIIVSFVLGVISATLYWPIMMVV